MERRVRLLLDTHVLLWAFRDPGRLSRHARELLIDPANELLVSAVSPWEISTKHRLGKLPGAEALLLRFADHLAELGAGELPITHRHAVTAGGMMWAHRDPFDRMLTAQAMLEGMPLVTDDAVFANRDGIEIRW